MNHVTFGSHIYFTDGRVLSSFLSPSTVGQFANAFMDSQLPALNTQGISTCPDNFLDSLYEVCNTILDLF